MALLVGTLLADAVALALSPFELFGPVRSVDPSPGFAADWTVLGLGALALLVALGVATVLFAKGGSPDRVARRGSRSRRAPSSLLGVAATSRLSTPAVTGVRFALDGGRGPSSVPVRSAISGSFLAVMVTMAALIFGSSLQTLINTPRLYGWNWDVAMEANAGYGDIPEPLADHLLSQDHSVAAFSGVYFETFALNGQGVPVLGTTPRATVQPPLLAGHGLNAPNQIVLGPATMAQLHLRLGDTVRARYTTHVTDLHVVGVATMPAIGIGHGLHLSLGVGALIDYKLIPATARNIQGYSTHGPNMILVRFRAGTNPVLDNRSLNRIVTAVSIGGSVLPVPAQRPAQIVNYRSMGSTPTLMAGALALGAFAALGLTLVASVRRRRRDLALFKTLGFTRRQLVTTVAWQASVTVGIGTLFGIPVGIAVGRALWDLFAREFYAISDPTVPVLAAVLLGLGALVLANVAAVLPGRYAAATPTALVLRAE
jgi:ABC-type lipoprotein release transport system permease subunit